jgi:hypothetical protein
MWPLDSERHGDYRLMWIASALQRSAAALFGNGTLRASTGGSGVAAAISMMIISALKLSVRPAEVELSVLSDWLHVVPYRRVQHRMRP